MKVSDHACGRARELASVELDEGLSQLEQARLGVHVRRCAACREFRLGIRATTETLRAAPLEQMERQIVLPRSRRMAVRPLQVGVAAMIVVATGFGAFIPLHARLHRPLAPAVGGSNQGDLRVLRDVRLQQIKPRSVGLAGGIQ